MLKSFKRNFASPKWVSGYWHGAGAPFFCIVFLFISAATFTQELPPIQNFTPVDYGAENQNWGISQGADKTIYIANNSGLLEFNGSVWRLYGSPNGSTLRSVKAVENRIYTGCYMEFGFWQKNVLGDLEYQSISTSLNITLLEDEEFWNILKLEEWILFQSLERIYIYNTSEESVTLLDARSTKAHMFSFEGTIYFHSVGSGLFKIENGRLVLVNDNPIVKENRVLGIFSIENKPVLVTEKGAFYFFDDTHMIPWETEFTKEEGLINVYSSLQLSDGSLVLGTISNGIINLDAKGELIQKINQVKGLNNNTVLSIFEDIEHNLWVAQDNGISVINMNSPFKEYIDKNGKFGVVYASTVYNGYLYLGTNQGLFYKSLDATNDFSLVKGTEGQVWVLKIIDDTLFCGHNNGTYVVSEEDANLISDFPGTWEIKPIPGKNNLLLQGNFKGLSLLEKSANGWEFRNTLEGFDISTRFFEFVDSNKIIVNHEFKGIATLTVDDTYAKVDEIVNSPSKGVGASLVTYLDEILYAADSGIFTYDSTKELFVPDSVLMGLLYTENESPIGILIPDQKAKRLWCFTNTNICYVSPGKLNARPKVEKVSIPTYVRKNLGVLGFESLTALGDERYLIGFSNGYLTMDLRKLARKEYQVSINSVALKSEEYVFEKIPKDSLGDFESEENNLSFSYSVPTFDKYTQVHYQYQLKGIYEGWSDWSTNTNVSFENLPYGNYVFNVSAQIGNSDSMNMASYAFRINRPWYLSNLAIVLYVIGFTLLAIAIHSVYRRYFEKQQRQLLSQNKRKLKRKRLKAEKKLVQIRNEKLREEVESKNRELAISTMSIIKKNKFLNAIKDQLREKSDSAVVKSVIRTIDRNISNEDDWNFFESAFNNADKDFLKNMKTTHPELTANDLRLCAYLRLNLSSKEIAPLLNISVKSVEVKRYRLRKKMNLDHENSLVAYIIDL